MIEKNRPIKLFLFLLLVSIFSVFSYDQVFALRGTLYNGKIFNVTSAGSKIQERDLGNISYQKFISGCAKFLPGVIENPFSPKPVDKSLCTPGYEFQGTLTGKGGRYDESTGTIIDCPEADGITSEDLMAIQSTIKIQNVGGNQFRVSFDFDTSKFEMRLLRKDYEADGSFTFNTSGDVGTYTVVNGNSFTINAGESFYVEFYAKTGICQGAYLSYVRDFAPNYQANPVLSYTYDNGTNICEKLKNDYKSDVIATGKVPYCYQNYINLGTEYPSREEVLAQVAEVEQIKALANSVTSSDTVRKCSFLSPQVSNNTTKTTSESGEAGQKNSYKTSTMGILTETQNNKWFQAQCTEYLEIYYDDPKAVNAGAGFSYTTILKIKRVCQPLQIATPRKKPKCAYEPSCWGVHHSGDKVAGPNEEFDSCVNTCDGGEYTQDCIDSCYQEVYGDEEVKTLTYTDKYPSTGMVNYSQKGIVRVRTGGYTTEPNCTPGVTQLANGKILANCSKLINNSGCTADHEGGEPQCYLEFGTKVQFANSCNGTDYCYEVYASSPDCSIDPEKEYYEDVQEALSEYRTVMNLISKEGEYKDETIYTGVYDHYADKQVDLPTYKTITNDIQHTEAEVRKVANTTQVDSRGYTITEDDLKYNFMIYTVTRTETIELTQAYISRSTNQDGTTGSVYSDEKLDCNDKDKNNLLCLDYYDGNNKWYTSLFAPEVNNWSNWPAYNSNQTDYTINNYDENIDVSLQKLGSWSQWNVDIDCIYGLYNNFYKCANGQPLVCNEDDICTCGIQYIFREIDLDDAFPNERNPRWNWQGTINTNNQTTGAARTEDTSLLNYRIDPDSLIDEIESKGETIYDVTSDASEVDYEFVLTRENLRNIRNYNKNVEDLNQDGSNNYLDYDQECYNQTVNGKTRKVCTSRFLDNEEYITYSSRSAGYTPEARRDLAVCNNARNLQCYDVTSGS